MESFLEISLIIGIATLLGIIMKLLKQPLIIAYIITGIIAGPAVMNVLGSTETISVFSHIGVALLLFIVGLNLNPRVAKDVGKVSILTGVTQVLFTSIVGFFLCRILGFSVISSLYVSVALSFSSTIIIMKLLSDKGDVEKLYGRVAVGFLIVQDLIAIMVLMLISSLHKELSISSFFSDTMLKGIGLLVLLLFIGYHVLPRLTSLIAKSQELLLMFCVGWALALSAIFYHLNFSMEIGALLAGITLSLSPYRYEIGCKMRPLRDFFLVLFFILLGSQMTFANIRSQILPVILCSLFVLIGNPLIVMIIMGITGYSKRSSFLAGLTVAQISEFSLILVALGVNLGHLQKSILSIVTSVGLITIAFSAYLITYGDKIFPHFSKYLTVFERKGRKVDEHKYHPDERYEVLLFGYNSIGHDLLESFHRIRKKFLVVDYNPETVVALAKEGVNCRYGDMNDSELLKELDLAKAKMIISTATDFEANMLLINKAREINSKAIIIVVSHEIDEAMELYERGATYVIMPHFLGGSHASTLIEKHKFNLEKFMEEQVAHVEHLKKKKLRGHEHPKHLL
ncbi:cation:proton antiporter [Candidatus Woesearchaeota archaeon]|nr:cation:proton antiporter [Candidatus Woesearchaeota archaeon]